MKPEVIFVENWDDYRTIDIQFECMESLSPGVWFHVRLNTVIIVNRELPHPLNMIYGKTFGYGT